MRHPTLPDTPVAVSPATSPAPEENGPILVAVDGGPASWYALNWAAAEAATRGVPLRTVNIYGWEYALDPHGVFYGWKAAVEGAVEILEAAHRQVAATEPLVQITGHAVFGQVPHNILRQAHSASLIVVGRTTRRQPRRWRPSLAAKLARHNAVPLAVVGPGNADAAGPGRGQIMLALTGPGDHADAIATAFRAASRRETGLIVVHTRPPAPPGGLDEALTFTLHEWQARLPDVAMQQRLLLTEVGHSVGLDAAGAGMLIVSDSSGESVGRRRWFELLPETTAAWLGDQAPASVLLMPRPPLAAR